MAMAGSSVLPNIWRTASDEMHVVKPSRLLAVRYWRRICVTSARERWMVAICSYTLSAVANSLKSPPHVNTPASAERPSAQPNDAVLTLVHDNNGTGDTCPSTSSQDMGL